MSGSFKAIVLREKNFPEHDLKDAIVDCSTINEFETTLGETTAPNLKIACTNDKLIEIAPLLLGHPNIDTIYVLTDQMDIMWPVELTNCHFEWIKINNEKELIRRLCIQAMLSYFEQGKKHEQNGDLGLANLCFLDAKKASNQKLLLI